MTNLPPEDQIPVLCHVCKEYKQHEPSKDCYLLQRNSQEPLTRKEVQDKCKKLDDLLDGAVHAY